MQLSQRSCEIGRICCSKNGGADHLQQDSEYQFQLFFFSSMCHSGVIAGFNKKKSFAGAQIEFT